MDDQQFGEFEDTVPQPPLPTSSSPINIQADPFLALSAQSTDSHHIDTANVHPYYSQESNPTESKPTDIDDVIKFQSFWPNMTKNASAHSAMDPPILVNFQKNHSLTGHNNPPTQQYDISSYLGEPDETKNQLSVSSSGVYSLNNQAYPKSLETFNFQWNNSQSPTISPIFNNFQQTDSPPKNQLSLNNNLYNSQPITKNEEFQLPLTSQPVQFQKIAVTQPLKDMNITLDYNELANQNQIQPTQLNSLLPMETKIQPQYQIPNQDNDQPIIEEQEFQFTDHNYHHQVPVQVNQSDIIKTPIKEIAIVEDDEYWKPSANIYNANISNETTQIVSENIKSSELVNQSAQLQPKAIESNQYNYVSQVRKQSDQFVFQETTTPDEQIILPTQNQVQEEQDQFGDFEQMPAHNQLSAQENPQGQNSTVNNQDQNKVQISSDYANTLEQQYYKSRMKQLQSLVDSLPDYSFLFLQAFQQ